MQRLPEARTLTCSIYDLKFQTFAKMEGLYYEIISVESYTLIRRALYIEFERIENAKTWIMISSPWVI